MTSPLDSYTASLDELKFTDEEKDRMTAKLKAAVEGEKAAPTPIIDLSSRTKARRPRRWMGIAAACLATALVLGGGGAAAVAVGVIPNPADVLSDIFGDAPAQTELLDNVGRPVGASSTSNGVTVTADAIIGDPANFTVVYSIEFDDPGVIESIVPLEGGALPLVADASVYVDGARSVGGGAYFYDADPADNSIQYVESMGVSTWNGASILGRTARFSMHGISVVDEAGGARALATGDWSLKFEINYADTAVELPAGQKTTWQGSDVTIDSVSVSSVAVTVSYTIDRQLGDLGPSGKMSDEAEAEQDAVIGLPIVVAFAEGEPFDATFASSSATKQNDGTTVVTKTATYNRIVDPDDIASVVVGDVEIPASADVA